MTQTTVFDFIPPTYDPLTCPWATDYGNGMTLCTFGGAQSVVDCGGGSRSPECMESETGTFYGGTQRDEEQVD